VTEALFLISFTSRLYTKKKNTIVIIMSTTVHIQSLSSIGPFLVKIFEVVERWVPVDVWVRDSSCVLAIESESVGPSVPRSESEVNRTGFDYVIINQPVVDSASQVALCKNPVGHDKVRALLVTCITRL
jgi:hypothetical protein